ncbi:MAG: LacI family DNA-binding transcriptional regulator [Clostridia bacterium]|nr:LacI family DNA-binding transcriptional regulator [Clostridia bacterium]
MKRLKISTNELAEICGVSQGTVDRALNNRDGINVNTKEHILRIAKEYGYRPYVSDNADKIKGQIGIIVSNLRGEYFQKLVTETEYILHDMNYAPAIMLSHGDRRKEIECIRSLYNMGVDGLIVCSVNGGQEFENYLKLFDVPVVVTGNQLNSVPYVGVDNYRAMYDFTTELLKDCYDEIIYFSPTVYGNTNNESARIERLEGFKAAMGNREFTFYDDPDKVPVEHSGKTLIVCFNDSWAVKLFFKVKNAYITGFDNTDALDRYHLKIDSVGYSMKEIAQGAMDVIMKKSKVNKYVEHYIVKR